MEMERSIPNRTKTLNKDSEAEENVCHSKIKLKKILKGLDDRLEHAKRNLLYMEIYFSPPGMFSYI